MLANETCSLHADIIYTLQFGKAEIPHNQHCQVGRSRLTGVLASPGQCQWLNCVHTVADLGFHEGGFVRLGALARQRKFLQTTPTSEKKPRPFT